MSVDRLNFSLSPLVIFIGQAEKNLVHCAVEWLKKTMQEKQQTLVLHHNKEINLH